MEEWATQVIAVIGMAPKTPGGDTSSKVTSSGTMAVTRHLPYSFIISLLLDRCHGVFSPLGTNEFFVKSWGLADFA
jgi:hypothetical protein